MFRCKLRRLPVELPQLAAMAHTVSANMLRALAPTIAESNSGSFTNCGLRASDDIEFNSGSALHTDGLQHGA